MSWLNQLASAANTALNQENPHPPSQGGQQALFGGIATAATAAFAQPPPAPEEKAPVAEEKVTEETPKEPEQTEAPPSEPATTAETTEEKKEEPQPPSEPVAAPTEKAVTEAPASVAPGQLDLGGLLGQLAGGLSKKPEESGNLLSQLAGGLGKSEPSGNQQSELVGKAVSFVQHQIQGQGSQVLSKRGAIDLG